MYANCIKIGISTHRNRKHKACVFLFYKGSPALLTPRSGNAAEPLRANAPLRFAIPSLHSLRLPCLHHRNRKHKACVFLFYKGSPALLTPRSGKAAEPLRANAPLRFAIPSLHSLRLPCLHHRNRKHKACVFLFYKGSPALLTPRSGNAAEPLRANAPLRFAIPSLHSLRLPCLHHRNRKHKACVFLFYKGSPALLTPRSGKAADPCGLTLHCISLFRRDMSEVQIKSVQLYGLCI